MDALLSLPVLSVLFLPLGTSYGTSLNILFFYLTWSTLLLSHSALKVRDAPLHTQPPFTDYVA